MLKEQNGTCWREGRGQQLSLPPWEQARLEPKRNFSVFNGAQSRQEARGQGWGHTSRQPTHFSATPLGPSGRFSREVRQLGNLSGREQMTV